MRQILIGIAMVVLVASGGVIGYVLRQAEPSAQVLGESTVRPFWQKNVLLVNDAGELVAWDKEHAPQPIAEFAGKYIRTAAVSPDEQRCVVVTETDGVSRFWLYEAGYGPQLLAAVEGSVSKFVFSPSGKLLLFVQQRKGAEAQELDLLTLASGTIRRIALRATAGIWLAEPTAVLSRDPEGQLWYHQFLADGSVDAALVPAKATSNPVAPATGSGILFTKSDEAASLVRFSLSTQEQQLIAPLPDVPVDALTLQARIAPGGAQMIVSAVGEGGTARSFLLQLASGVVQEIPLATSRFLWFDQEQVLTERTTEEGSMLSLLHPGSSQYRNVPGSQALHLLP